jgi:hypothetical protein
LGRREHRLCPDVEEDEMMNRAIWLLPAVVAILLLGGCRWFSGPQNDDRFRYAIDETIEPTLPEVVGLNGGPPRAVGAVVGTDGSREEFVVDEVVYRPKSKADLDAFLAEYNGAVIRDGTPLLLPEVAARSNAPPESSGWYLIRIDPQRSSLSDLATNMERGGSRGLYRFSSEDAARLLALLAREKVTEERRIGPNPLALPTAVEEHPDGTGEFLDAETWWWMSEDDDPDAPGEKDYPLAWFTRGAI